jgi:peptidoglycan/LPS O-acetylase OafA/YrhL
MGLAIKLGYRPEIDGLRAVAVLSVVAFHYGAPIRGGFTGVDVFFVISGFLITQILSAEIVSGTFSVLGFYDRRMRRILPALLVMLAATLLAGALLLFPGDYTALATSGAYASLGASNFFFLYNTGYFDQVAELMPLLHTWSLAVEEQFYLIWPVLLFALVAGRSRTVIAAILGTGVLACCIGSIVYFRFDPKAAFYLPLPRAWELGLGALLAFLPPLSYRAGEIATTAGLALIGFGFFKISPQNFPGAAALYPCVGAALVLWPNAEKTPVSRTLGLLAPIGLISYSLYLWHWPIWVFYRFYINNGTPGALRAMMLVIVSIAVATLSYRYVEQPFRKRRWPAARTVSIGFAGIAVVFCLSIYVQRSDGLPQRLPADAQIMRSLDAMWEWPCKTAPIKGIAGDFCVFGAPWESAKQKTMIWGDSHAEHFAPIVDAINADPGRAFLVFAGCSAVLGGKLLITFEGSPQQIERCKEMQPAGLKILKEDPAINQVVITSNWLDLPVRIGKGDAAGGLAAMHDELTRIITESATPGRRFFLMGTVPEIPRTVVECAHTKSSALLRAPCDAAVRSADAMVVKKKTEPIDDMLKELARKLPEVTAVIPAERLCRDDECAVYLDGEFLYRDIGHIRRNLRLQTKKDFAEKIGLTAALTNPPPAQTGVRTP